MMNFMIVPGMLFRSIFLISAHIKCYSDCSRRESHLVEPLCYGVFNVCHVVFCTRVAWVCLVC